MRKKVETAIQWATGAGASAGSCSGLSEPVAAGSGESIFEKMAGHDRDCRDGHSVFDVFTGAEFALDKDGIGLLASG